MPQNRRKIPFTGKKKKEQLSQKRQSKRSELPHTELILQPFNRCFNHFIDLNNPYLLNKSLKDESESEDDSNSPSAPDVRKINYQPSTSGRTNRYVFHFYRETDKQVNEMKLDARRELEFRAKTGLEVGDTYFVSFDFPRRPDWTYEMSKEQLDYNENKYFRDYMQKIEKSHYDEKKLLSYCELNLETWRQLWRVLELSDIVLVIVDIRFPSLMFPPSLYQYINDCGKQMILVLNKIDYLATPEVVLAWRQYFKAQYPNLEILAFTSFPGSQSQNAKKLQRRRRFGKLKMASQGALKVYEKCKEMVGDNVDLQSWGEKIESEISQPFDAEDQDSEIDVASQFIQEEEEKFFDFSKPEKFKNGILTVGCIGFPNAGKSSLMNALMGRKVVSVSRTPGHTKHFQTIFLTDNVRLCDCPGLVFPSSVPRSLQVLMGSYPIAQLREPYAPLRFIAERVNLVGILNIQQEDGEKWSPILICEAWAMKRGFLTARSGRPDVARAANNILRMALDGKIVMSLKPPQFYEKIEEFRKHADIKEIEAILSRKISEDLEVLDEEHETEEEDSENGAGPSQERNIEVETVNPFELLTENGE